MQSGISASEELHAQFQKLHSDPSYFALLVTVDQERLVPRELLAKTTEKSALTASDEDIAQLKPFIAPNEALYVILRRHEATPAYTLVSYVPDLAPIRQKMLFASTRLTLTRELGSELFRESMFATLPGELTPDGFRKYDEHARLAAPLTEEEASLGAVKQAEMAAGQGSGYKQIHMSSHASIPLSDDAATGLKALAAGERSVLMLKINPETEAIVMASEIQSADSLSGLIGSISTTEPCYTFYQYSHANPTTGESVSPLLFVYSFPAPSSGSLAALKSRMLYPLHKRALLTAAKNDFGVEPVAAFQVEDLADLNEKLVHEELYPAATAKKSFARPRRPGR